MTRRLVTLTALLYPLLHFGVAAGQEATTGTIEGTITNQQGTPLVGVTVTVTSVQGTRAETSDAGGKFRFPHLTAGTYHLRAMKEGFNTAELSDLEVRLGSRMRADVEMAAGATEVVNVVGTATTIDLSTTTTGATIDSEMMSTIPIGRNFASTLQLVPGVVGSGIDESNPSISGASGLENTYVIDGVGINNTGYGSAGSYSIVLGALGTGVNFDYIQEVQVKTGAYDPEYGEALGGYVNLVTKTGGNELKGSGFVYHQGSGFEEGRATTDRVRAEFDEVGFTSTDFGFELGGPLARDKAFFFGAFDPTLLTLTRQSAAATGFDHRLDVDREIYNYAGNVKWLVNPNHTLTISAFGDPSKGKMGPQREDAVAVSDPKKRFSELRYGGNNAVVRWQGSLTSKHLFTASYAYHEDKFEEDLNFNEPNGVDNRPTGIDPTAPPLFYGGSGFFANSKSKNHQYKLALSSFVEAGGEHHFRYGVEFQDISYDNEANYSGPSGNWIPVGDPDPITGAPTDSVLSTTGYSWNINASGSRFRISRIRSGEIRAETSADYLAFFLQDTWQPVPWVSLMGGIRYEQETIQGTLAKHSWKDNWAPRASLVVDPLQDGRTKVSFSYGRFFGKVPNDLAVRALSSEVTHVVDFDVADVDLTDPNNPVLPGASASTFWTAFGDEPTVIDDNSKLTYQDEYVAAVEREVQPLVNVGLTYKYRTLGRTLEDVALVPYSEVVTTGNFGNYYITNPTPADGFPEPSRKYHAVTLTAEKRSTPSAPWRWLASYTWSRLKGNYEGYYRRDNDQSDPFITSLFDFPYLADPEIFQYLIADGLLPNDRTHVINLFGSYRFQNNVTVGASLQRQSGVPLTKLGYNDAYGNGGEIPLAERGSRGRTPTTTNIGMHVGYVVPMGDRKVEFIADVFNLLNQQKGIEFDQDFEVDGTIDPHPSLGLAPCPECENPDFSKATRYERPLSFRFAMRVVQ